jgi:hypothetical protein
MLKIQGLIQPMFFHRHLATRVVVLALGAFAFHASSAQTTLRFGEGAAEVTVPAHYAPAQGQDASLVVLSKPEGNVELYFDLHKLDATAKVAKPGEAFVREQAEKKGKPLRLHAGKVVLFDPSPPAKVGEEVVANFHWQVGFEKTVIVISARVPYAAREEPDVKRFFSGDMEAIIASLRRVDG